MCKNIETSGKKHFFNVFSSLKAGSFMRYQVSKCNSLQAPPLTGDLALIKKYVLRKHQCLNEEVIQGNRLCGAT